MTDNIPVAVAYRLNGANFRASAETLGKDLELDGSGRPTSLTAIPVYFLASQAAELFLKAALLKRGFSEGDLKKRHDLRHNLEALLQEILNKGVPVAAETAAIIVGLSEQHKTHQLRYTVLLDNGAETYWPPLALLFGALDELLMLTRISTHGA